MTCGRLHQVFALFLGVFILCARSTSGAYSDADVAARIRSLQNEIINAQNADGSWSYNRYPVGMTALALLALRTSQVEVVHPSVQAGLKYILPRTDSRIYSEALVLCALELLEPELHRRRMQQALDLLVHSQTDGGAWSYEMTADGTRGQGYDHSNSQFAVLGLAAAVRVGLNVPEQTKQRALTHWKSAQNNDGGWGYRKGDSSYAAMTCAGIASLHALGTPLDVPAAACGSYVRNPHLARGLGWLAHYVRNSTTFQQRHPAYALYALERVGILMNLKQIGGVDWYNYGVGQMLETKTFDDLAERAFALLFLAKGNAPIAIAKWQWDGDWNNDRQDVKNWLQGMGARLERQFDWTFDKLETLDSSAAKASLVFVNGHNTFSATASQMAFVRAFLNAGGTLVAEGCCASRTFIRSFANFFSREFEPGRVLDFVPLADNHPLLSAYYQLDADEVAGYTLKSGCRSHRLILLTRDISCALNGEPVSAAERIRAQKVAGNLLVWALQSKAADKKLDTVTLPAVERDTSQLTMDQVQRTRADAATQLSQGFGRLKHRGEWSVDPHFFANLRVAFQGNQLIPAFDGEVVVDPLSEDLFQVAMLFMAGHGDPALTEEETLSIQQYLANDGFLLASACCSEPAFDAGFRRLLEQMLPRDQLERIPLSDDLWHLIHDCRLQAAEGTEAYHAEFQHDWAPLYGVRREGRWILVYSPIDFCCALEDDLDPAVPAYTRGSSLKLLANILRYAFTPAAETWPSIQRQ